MDAPPLTDPPLTDPPQRRTRRRPVAVVVIVAVVALVALATAWFVRTSDGDDAAARRSSTTTVGMAPREPDGAPEAADLLAYDPIDLGAASEDPDGVVTLRSPGADGTVRPVEARVTRADGAPVGCAVVVHGLGGDADQMSLVAAPLALMGWTTIAPDMAWGTDVERVLGGEDGGALDGAMRNELVDVRRAIDWLEAEGDCAGRIAYVGVSMGAMGGVPVIAADDRIDGSILVVPGGEYRPAIENAGFDPEVVDLSAWDPVRFAPQIDDRPMLVVNARDDELIEPANAAQLRDALPAATRVWVDGGHTPDASAILQIVVESRALLDRIG
jgi:dienelactone hydrolase